jgi:ceramide glucosyltransferase
VILAEPSGDLNVIVAVLELFAGAGVVICLLGLFAVRRFTANTRNGGKISLVSYPPVTILKPLCGDEPLLEEGLESCFAQEFPEFQIVFGVHDAADPALATVEALRRRFPARDIKVVIDPALHGSNRKLSNLINMLPFAKHDILVISDSDLYVPTNYLQRLLVELQKPGTGLVTSLYFGRPPASGGWAQRLGMTQMNHTFLPGVLLSRALGRQDCLGSTAMFRRETLEKAGGFHPMAHVLAEDNVMGQRIRSLGLSIRLAGVVPMALVSEDRLGAVWQHEIRWARTIRELAPVSLCLSTLQHPLFWSCLAMILAGGAPWSVALFLGCWFVRAACGHGIDRALRGHLLAPAAATPFYFFPLRDLLSVLEIGASFVINEVTWRGQKLAATGTVIVPIPGGEGVSNRN